MRRPASRDAGRRRSGSLQGTRVENRREDRETRITSVRIGDIGRERRREPRHSGALRIFLMVVGAVIVLALICAVVFAVLLRTGAFAIEDLDVVGADHLTMEEVSQIVSLPDDATLLNVDVDGVKSNLERDAWIQDVEVKRSFPSTLRIVITEREIAAVVEVPVGSAQTIQDWAIASDGMWLMAIPSQDSAVGQSLSEKIYEDADEVLWITDIPYGTEPAIGAYCTDDNIINALDIVAGMTTELADQVKTVSATDAESTLLTLDDGVEIAFGTAEDIREKERICLEIISENPTAVYINVRVVERPTWRAA